MQCTLHKKVTFLDAHLGWFKKRYRCNGYTHYIFFTLSTKKKNARLGLSILGFVPT